jgi:hypothetical protein
MLTRQYKQAALAPAPAPERLLDGSGGRSVCVPDVRSEFRRLAVFHKPRSPGDLLILETFFVIKLYACKIHAYYTVYRNRLGAIGTKTILYYSSLIEMVAAYEIFHWECPVALWVHHRI